MSEDNELERLKAERLAEMQKNLSLQKEQQKQDEISEDTKKKTPSQREILVNHFSAFFSAGPASFAMNLNHLGATG